MGQPDSIKKLLKTIALLNLRNNYFSRFKIINVVTLYYFIQIMQCYSGSGLWF